jgi:hypothetical protein
VGARIALKTIPSIDRNVAYQAPTGSQNIFSARLVHPKGMDAAKQDLVRKVDRLTKEIVQCQNAMEADIPCRSSSGHTEWLGQLQAELAEAETKLANLS